MAHQTYILLLDSLGISMKLGTFVSWSFVALLNKDLFETFWKYRNQVENTKKWSRSHVKAAIICEFIPGIPC